MDTRWHNIDEGLGHVTINKSDIRDNFTAEITPTYDPLTKIYPLSRESCLICFEGPDLITILSNGQVELISKSLHFATSKDELAAMLGRIGFDWGTAHLYFDMFKVGVKGKFKGPQIKNGDVILFGAEVGASYATIDVNGDAEFGNEALGASVKFDGQVTGAEAEAGGGIGYEDGKLDLFIEGKAVAAFYKGEVKPSITILGYTLEFQLGGFAAGAGVEGKIGMDDGKFSAKIGGGVGIGGSVGFTFGKAD